MKSKKHLIILVLKILESHTDSNHPMTQTEMAKIISMSFPCDRKTVGRNIKFLKEIGYPIVKTSRGFYLNKTFTLQEIDYILEAITLAPTIASIDKDELYNKAKKQLSKSIKRI